MFDYRGTLLILLRSSGMSTLEKSANPQEAARLSSEYVTDMTVTARLCPWLESFSA